MSKVLSILFVLIALPFSYLGMTGFMAAQRQPEPEPLTLTQFVNGGASQEWVEISEVHAYFFDAQIENDPDKGPRDRGFIVPASTERNEPPFPLLLRYDSKDTTLDDLEKRPAEIVKVRGMLHPVESAVREDFPITDGGKALHVGEAPDFERALLFVAIGVVVLAVGIKGFISPSKRAKKR